MIFTHATNLSRLSLFYAVVNGFLRVFYASDGWMDAPTRESAVDDKQTLVGSLMTRSSEGIRADTEAGKCVHILSRK